VEERPNPLLKRTEYRFEIVHAEAATPTRDQVRGELSKQLKVPKERLIVERMHARFGAPMTRGEALAYADPKAALAISREHILIRNGLKEQAAPAAPGPAPAAPAPAEKSAEKPSEKAAEKHSEKSAEKPSEKAAEKHSEKSAERPSEKASEKHSEKASEKPSEKPAGKAEKASAKKE
jgi:ribosomal protein S24E